MKDPLERTKVVLRHLPPSLTETVLMEQIDGKFSGRYKWLCFRSGKESQKNGRYARAYIDFNRPADVFEFAGFFDGHVFVNEKGTQFKVMVEYAPSQIIPKIWAKKDGREGSIFKDPDYMEFLEHLAKPVENLPSAEIQLERREAERVGVKETPIITPLMDFVRQKRASTSGSQRTSCNVKTSRRAVVAGHSSTHSSKRSSDRRRGTSLKYVSKDRTRNISGKEKPTYILVSRRDEQNNEKFNFSSSIIKDGTQNETGLCTNEIVSGMPVTVETGKKALLLLKGNEREGSHIQRFEVPGRIIKSILSNKEGRQLPKLHPDVQMITGNTEKDKHPSRPPIHPNLKEHSPGLLRPYASEADAKTQKVDKVASSELHSSAFFNDNKFEKRTKNKDRPDRGVWAPLRRTDGLHGQSTNLLSINEIPGGHGNIKSDTPNGNKSSESKILGGGRSHHTSLDNSAHRHVGRRGMQHGSKDLDGSVSTMEGKPSKRGPNPYEKQVWVQKSGSAS